MVVAYPANGGVGYIVCYEGGNAHCYSTRDGLYRGLHLSILSAAKGQIRAAGVGGISRFRNGRFETLTRQDGLPDDNFFAAMLDDDQLFDQDDGVSGLTWA
jgi:hypothetical protein